MHENFPIIEKNQVAVLYADYNTGIILNTNLKYNLNQKALEYLLFNSLDDAKIHCFEKIKAHPNIECIIYDWKAKELLKIDIIHTK